MPPHHVPSALRTLVAGLVDYAGLFPPAALAMSDAAAAYAAYVVAPDAWMLGRFVVPVARLDELAIARAALGSASGEWRLAALAGPDVAADVARLADCNRKERGQLRVDVLEAKAATPADVARLANAVRATSDELTLYVELPVADDPRALVDAARAAGVRAKVRTGGLTPEAFPTARQLARFIARCAEARVPFKATAGLHHPLRAEHRLTYEADAPRGTMFGFLNVFGAAAFALGGMREEDLAALLEERDATQLAFDDASLRWRGHACTTAQLADARATFAIAFGSCSFREPSDELHQPGFL